MANQNRFGQAQSLRQIFDIACKLGQAHQIGSERGSMPAQVWHDKMPPCQMRGDQAKAVSAICKPVQKDKCWPMPHLFVNVEPPAAPQ
jgi:hypothetical protein